MFQLYCDFCGKPERYGVAHIIDLDVNVTRGDGEAFYHLCDACYSKEKIRYDNYRLTISERIKTCYSKERIKERRNEVKD